MSSFCYVLFLQLNENKSGKGKELNCVKVRSSVKRSTCLFHIELSEHHVCGLSYFRGISCKADLIWMFGHEGQAVLLQLLEGLRLALRPRSASSASILDQRLQAELDSNGH